MVTILRVLTMFVLVAIPYTCLAAALTVETRDTTAELGRPLQIQLTGDNLENDLAEISLDELRESFAIANIDTYREEIKPSADSMQAVISRQVMKLKVYPTRTGTIRLSPFNMDNTQSDALQFTINEATSKGERITLDWHLSSKTVWQREQVLVKVVITTPEKFATIRVRQEELSSVEITPLPVSREWSPGKQGGRSELKTGWSLLPLTAGETSIRLPAVEYILNGVTRRVFYLPDIPILVRQLPSYLPPTIPVGKIQFSSAVEPEGILVPGELAYWNVSLGSSSLTPYWLPPVLRQIKSGQGIEFLPASSQRSIRPDEGGVNSRVEHRIPFKPLHNGYTGLPELRIQYFDTDSGKIVSAIHPAGKTLALGYIPRLIIILITAACLVLLTKYYYHRTTDHLRYRKLYHRAIENLESATNTDQIVEALRSLCRAEGWSENVSLSDWLRSWKQKFASGPELQETIDTVSVSRYGNQPADQADIAEITASIVKCIRER